MSARPDCRHYILQTTRSNERVERCRLGANVPVPFSCPEECLFFEARRTSSAGWTVAHPDDEPDK